MRQTVWTLVKPMRKEGIESLIGRIRRMLKKSVKSHRQKKLKGMFLHCRVKMIQKDF